MARFPYYPKNVAALGRLIARARLDEAFAQQLRNDPKKVLKAAGLPDQTIELIDFRIVDARLAPDARVLPYRLNSRKLSEGDADYVSGVARLLC
ncbi:hypothetical protein FMN50_23365 [Rhodobacterales bacterium]|nr:hypothetical protein FMN50_23365 [Rhodobacterales bacterium]